VAARKKSPVRTAWSAARKVAFSSLFACAKDAALPQITAASDIVASNNHRDELRNAMLPNNFL